MTTEEIAQLERLAEAAYEEMYDAQRYRVKECFQDASGYLAEAIELAERDGLTEVATRLKARKEHIYNVYTHQFR